MPKGQGTAPEISIACPKSEPQPWKTNINGFLAYEALQMISKGMKDGFIPP